MTVSKKNIKAWKGAVKGLDITTIVLSSISLMISVVAIIYLIIAIWLTQSTDAILDIAKNAQMSEQTYLSGNDLIVGQTQTSIIGLANLGFAFMLCFTILSMLFSGFSLFVAIFTLIDISKKKINKYLFPLHVIAAVGSLLSISIFRFVATIISSIYIYKISESSK